MSKRTKVIVGVVAALAVWVIVVKIMRDDARNADVIRHQHEIERKMRDAQRNP